MVRPMARSRSSRRSSSSSLRRTLAMRLLDRLISPSSSLPSCKEYPKSFSSAASPSCTCFTPRRRQRDPHLQRSPNTQKSSDDKRQRHSNALRPGLVGSRERRCIAQVTPLPRGIEVARMSTNSLPPRSSCSALPFDSARLATSWMTDRSAEGTSVLAAGLSCGKGISGGTANLRSIHPRLRDTSARRPVKLRAGKHLASKRGDSPRLNPKWSGQNTVARARKKSRIQLPRPCPPSLRFPHFGRCPR